MENTKMETQTNFDGYKFEKHEKDSDFMKLSFGESAIGVYLGKEQSKKYPDTFNYKFDFKGEIGIKFMSGVVVSSHIDDEKNPIPIGSVVKFTSLGRPKGKNYDDYDIFVGEKK